MFLMFGVASKSDFDFEDPKHATQVLNPTSCQGPYPNVHFFIFIYNEFHSHEASFIFWIFGGGPLPGHIFPFLGAISPSWAIRGTSSPSPFATSSLNTAMKQPKMPQINPKRFKAKPSLHLGSGGGVALGGFPSLHTVFYMFQHICQP